MSNEHFYTFSDYMKNNGNLLSASMEDYVEMIYRLSKEHGFTRVNELSIALNVQPPSTTRMIQRLSHLGLIEYQKYGVIVLKEEGKRIGQLLLNRHQTIETFLQMMGVEEESILSETEKIEHTLSPKTYECFEEFLHFLSENNTFLEQWKLYKSNGKNA